MGLQVFMFVLTTHFMFNCIVGVDTVLVDLWTAVSVRATE